MSGCGWGSASARFQVTATPVAMTVTAGTAGPAIQFAVTPASTQTAAVVVTLSPPAGIGCSATPCSVSFSQQGTGSLTLMPAATMAAGTYAVPMKATIGGVAVQTPGSLAVTVVATTTSPTADFSFTVSPVSASIVAGSATGAFSFSVARTGGQTAPVAVTTALPSGFACSALPCGTTVTGTESANAFTLAPGASVAAGSYPVVFTGTDGVTTHTATATVTVTAVTTPVPPAMVASGCMATPYVSTVPLAGSHLDFVYTGASGSTTTNQIAPLGLVYDAVHNLVFESNPNLNEVDVIEPNTLRLIHRISVPQPTGMDLTPDGKTLLVGSATPAFFRIDTGTFCVTNREEVSLIPYSNSTGPSYAYYPRSILALSDGTIAMWMASNTSDTRFVIRTTAGTLVQQPTGDGTGGIARSGDRNHVFVWGNDSGGWYGRYDVSTGTTVGRTINFGGFPVVYAVNQDGSRVLASLGTYTGELDLADANYNVIRSIPGQGSVALATPDLSRVYFKSYVANLFVVNAGGDTLSALGFIPGSTDYGHEETTPRAFDGTGRLLATAEMGLAVIPAVAPQPGLRTVGLRSGYSTANSGLVPDNPAQGLSTTVNGNGFAANPTVFFDGVAATNSVSVTSGYYAGTEITTTAPLLNTDCSNVEVRYADGAAMEPLSYCYRPRVLYTGQNGGSSAGGGAVTLFGRGFGLDAARNPSTTRVLIGGVDATNVVNSWNGISPYPLELSVLSAVAPPGRAGKADIQIITAGGSTTLPGAYTYADVTETPLPTGAAPYEVVLDSPRSRLLISDTTNNQLLVYSTAGKQLQKTVALGGAPHGIALTPDGTRLLVTVGKQQLTVLDAESYAVQKQVILPASIYTPTSDTTGLFRVVPLANNTAFLMVNEYYLYNATIQYSLANDSMRPRTGSATLFAQSSQDGVGTPDGQWAAVSGNIYSTTTDSFTAGGFGVSGTSISGDGQRFVSGAEVFRQGTVLLNELSSYDLLTGDFSYIFDGVLVAGGRFNPGNSLFIQPTAIGAALFGPTPAALRVWDVPHGTLLTEMSVPGTALTIDDYNKRLTAAADDGTRVWMVTSKGIEDIQFVQAPLTVGTVSVAGSVLTAMGSGFTSTMLVQIDGQSVTASVAGTTQFTTGLPTLAAGAHAVRVTDGADRSYTLDLAFTTQ